MTNTQIIYSAALAHGFTADQLAQLAAAFNGDLPFHTFQDWKARGFHVKKGEKALFTADLWKYTSKPTKAQREAAAQAGEGSPEAAGHYYKKLSHLFSFSQVERDEPPTA
ncbi:MAG: ArdC family protein [Roseburia sp.]|nr:ArdC family protein [Roseburia sp.]